MGESLHLRGGREVLQGMGTESVKARKRLNSMGQGAGFFSSCDPLHCLGCWKIANVAEAFQRCENRKQPRCPSADEWIRKLWYKYTMKYYSVIKKNSFESVLMRWMKLEPIIQSEVSQKDKHQYSILMHIYGILKDGNDNPICKTEKETQMYRTDFGTLWEKARVGWMF